MVLVKFEVRFRARPDVRSKAASRTDIAGKEIVVARVRIVVPVVDEPGREIVSFGNFLIDLESRVFIFLPRLAGEKQRARDAVAIGGGGQGSDGRIVDSENFLHHRIESHAGCVVAAIGGGDIQSLGSSGGRIGVGEDAALEGRRGHGGVVGQIGDETIALVIEEEEGPVLDDGPTKGSAIDVANVGILGLEGAGSVVVEVVACAERIPASEIKSVAVELVAAAARDHIDHRAVVAAEFRREVVGDDAELLGGIGILRGEAGWSARNFGVVVVGAIEHEIVVAFAASVNRETAQARVGRHRARRQQH